MPAKPKSFGQPAGRLAKLIVETTMAEPYVVTDTIIVAPLTKTRSQALTDALTKMGVTNSLMQQAMKGSGLTRPEYPAMPQPPGDVNPETLATYQAAITAHGDLVLEWEKRHAQWEADVDKLEATMKDLAAEIEARSDDYSRALFGDAYDDVMEFFAGQPVELWNAFVTDIKEEFGVAPKHAQVPEDGKCTSCGHVIDEEQAGKAPESST
ncbi:hypothetical protein [Mycolicibacterium brisbanense]